jgi:hypothetical protein
MLIGLLEGGLCMQKYSLTKIYHAIFQQNGLIQTTTKEEDGALANTKIV